MTRESKLALVLGFSLMLFVLILVSDHLAARNAPLVASGAIARPEVGVPPLPVPGGGDQIILTGGASGDGRAAAVPPGEPAYVSPPPSGKPESSIEGSREGTQVASSGSDGQGSNDRATVPPAPKLPETPSIKTYTIKAGDTFAAIAAREYKKRSLGEKLAAFNQIDPSRMKVGTVVKLPPVHELDPSQAPTRLASESTDAGNAGSSERTASREPVFRVYKVKEGDTLYGIAQRELGTANRWKELKSANSEVLKGGSDLHPGMQIRIPESRSTLTSASTDA